MCVVIICGIEPVFKDDGSFKLNSATFMNNARTYVEDHPNERVCIFDMRDYKDVPEPMIEVLAAVAKTSRVDGVDLLVYNGHSSTNTLLALYKTRAELPDTSRFITKRTRFPKIEFSEGARVELWGCRTAGNYVIDPDSIAQHIANTLKLPTLGWICRTSQKKVGKKFYQKPENSSYSMVIFQPS